MGLEQALIDELKQKLEGGTLSEKDLFSLSHKAGFTIENSQQYKDVVNRMSNAEETLNKLKALGLTDAEAAQALVDKANQFDSAGKTAQEQLAVAQAEIKTLKAKITDLQTGQNDTVATYEKVFTSELEKAMDGLSDEDKALISEAPLAQRLALANRLKINKTEPKNPDTPGGKPGDNPTEQLNETQKQTYDMWKAKGYTHDQLMDYLLRGVRLPVAPVQKM